MTVPKPLDRVPQRRGVAPRCIATTERIDEDEVWRKERDALEHRVREELHIGADREQRREKRDAVGAAERMVAADDPRARPRNPRAILVAHLRRDAGLRDDALRERLGSLAMLDARHDPGDLREAERVLYETKRCLRERAQPGAAGTGKQQAR